MLGALSWIRRKPRLAALTAVVVLAVAGGAIAYFTDSGSGTGHATVGSSTPWSVTFGTTTGTMYPGAGTSTVNYTVTNAGSGHQYLHGTTASVVADGSGNIKDNGTAVSGCLASWFNATNHSPSAADLAVSGTATGSVDVTMTNDPSNQDVCQGHHPDILVSAN